MGRVFLIMIGLLIPASKLGAQAISLTIPAGVDAIGIFRTEVVGGNPAVATITYNYGGQLVVADVVSVSLSSSNPSVASLPSSIDVQGGIATVEIATQSVNGMQTVTITASSNSLDSKSATLTVKPSSEASLKSLTFAAAAIKAGEGTIGTLRLSKPAMRAITVSLSSAPHGTLQTPSTITFYAGESEKTFKVLSAERTRPQRVVLDALQVNAPAVKAVLEIK